MARRLPTSTATSILDVVITTNGGPASLYRNDSRQAAQAFRVRVHGVTSNRDGIGARVRVFAGTDRLSRAVKTGSSYLSQSELPLTFGLGSRPRGRPGRRRVAERRDG